MTQNQEDERRWWPDWFGNQSSRSDRRVRRASDYLLDAVFVTLGTGKQQRDVLVCVRRHADDLEEAMDARIPGRAYGYHVMGVRGPDEPYSILPDVDVVHVVGYGGVDSEFGDTGRDWSVVEIFTDLGMARAAAREHPVRDVTIQTMVLDEMLPLPAKDILLTSAESSRLLARECIAPLASNFRDFRGSHGSARSSATTPMLQKLMETTGRRQSRNLEAGGVLVFTAFERSPGFYSQGKQAHAYLFAVTRSITKLVDLVVAELDGGRTLDLGWEQHYLQGPTAPYPEWPDIESLHIVHFGDTARSSSATQRRRLVLGVFADLASAHSFATQTGGDEIRVSSVPIDTGLPESPNAHT